MKRHRWLHLAGAFVATLLWVPSCDVAQMPTDLSPQFHGKEDDELCELPTVDCIAELDQPASYAHTKNMKLMGFSARTVPHGTSAFNSDLAFWGRTAYQGTYTGFRIIDISQPDNPVELIDYDQCSPGTVRGSQGDVLVWQNLLIRSWDAPTAGPASCGGMDMAGGREGLHIFDVSSPTSPQLLGFVDLPCGSHTALLAPDPANGLLVVYSSPSSAAPLCRGLDVVVVPLSNPAAASYLYTLHTDSPELQCHDGSVILGSVNLLACAGGGGFTVWSLAAADGATLVFPVWLYEREVPGVSIGHSTAFTWDGEMLVLGHEPGGGSQARCQASSQPLDRALYFFSARTGDPLGSFLLPRTQSAQENCTWHNYNVVPAQGRHLLVSGNYQSGISVIDFTDLTNIREIAYADPPPLVNPANPAAVVLGGDWAAYWYNGFIYESDIRRGLVVWRLSDAAAAGALRLDHLNPQTQMTSAPLRGK